MCGLPTISEEAPLVLGSASPRRREILAQLGVPFVVAAASADEDVRPGEAPGAYLARVVLAKLGAVRASLEPGLRSRASCVLVADTTVVLGLSILGKPRDAAESFRFIRELAGRTHDVYTRFAIASAESVAAPVHVQTVGTRVTFRPLTDAEARAYAESGEGMDKAGGYAVQGRAAGFAERIDGSYTNVVGLPAAQVMLALRELALVA